MYLSLSLSIYLSLSIHIYIYIIHIHSTLYTNMLIVNHLRCTTTRGWRGSSSAPSRAASPARIIYYYYHYYHDITVYTYIIIIIIIIIIMINALFQSMNLSLSLSIYISISIYLSICIYIYIYIYICARIRRTCGRMPPGCDPPIGKLREGRHPVGSGRLGQSARRLTLQEWQAVSQQVGATPVGI